MSKNTPAEPSAIRRFWPTIVMGLIFLVSLNLRPAITSVGPLLGQIGSDQNLGKDALGLLGALPLIAFAVISPLIHVPARRLGIERLIMLSLLALAAGIAIRSFLGTPGLWWGTIILGLAIAVGNVLVPTIVKRDYSGNISIATAIYSACISIGAAVASVVAVPIANRSTWQESLAWWAIPALVVAVLWLPRMRTGGPIPVDNQSAEHPSVSVWKQPTAWLVTAFFGLQSTSFYVMVTWLPSIEASNGISEARAGVHLFIYQALGIVSGFMIPKLMKNEKDQTLAAVVSSIPMLIAILGLMLAPQFTILWPILAGIGSGATLVVGLSLISYRGRSHHETTQLSGMAQSIGYLFAATGPILTGFLAEQTGNWQAALGLMAIISIAHIAVAYLVGKDRFDQETTTPTTT